MKKHVLFIIPIFLLLGCKQKNFSGNLQVKSTLKLKGTLKSLMIQRGVHSMKLRFKSSRRAVLKISNKTFMVQFKKKFSLPDTGKFEIDNTDWNLNLNIDGSVEKNITRSPLINEYETCYYEYPTTYCTPYGCDTRWVSVLGSRQVEYYNETIHLKMNSYITDKKSGVATYSSVSNSTNKYYTFTGICR